MELRTARPEDAEPIAAVVTAARRNAFEDLVGGQALEELDPEDEVRVWTERLAAAPADHLVVVADEADRVIGVVAWSVPPSDGPGTPPEATLKDLYVHPAAQGAGVGAQLLTRSQESLQDGSGRPARALVHSANWWTARLLETHGWARDPATPPDAAPDEHWIRRL
jgi:ribosomal protein S18 acetylase RimI-like enzyme